MCVCVCVLVCVRERVCVQEREREREREAPPCCPRVRQSASLLGSLAEPPGFEFGVAGVGFRFSVFGSRVSDLDFGFQVSVFVFRVSCFAFRVSVCGVGVSG